MLVSLDYSDQFSTFDDCILSSIPSCLFLPQLSRGFSMCAFLLHYVAGMNVVVNKESLF